MPGSLCEHFLVLLTRHFGSVCILVFFRYIILEYNVIEIKKKQIKKLELVYSHTIVDTHGFFFTFFA